jgi:hypothetical protein
MPDDELRAVCNDALRVDALCALAWFNLGGAANRAGESEEALYSFLIAALLEPGDIEAWANVIGTSINATVERPVDGAATTALLAIAAGYGANGEDFVLHLAERVKETGREGFVAMIRKVVAEVVPSSEAAYPVVRVFGPDGTLHELRATRSKEKDERK